jgi:hypothetical protein
MTSIFDPDPDNQLGKHILDPALEASLVARGVVFAARLPPRKGKPFWSLVCSLRPIADAVTDGELDNPLQSRTNAHSIVA